MNLAALAQIYERQFLAIRGLAWSMEWVVNMFCLLVMCITGVFIWIFPVRKRKRKKKLVAECLRIKQVISRNI